MAGVSYSHLRKAERFIISSKLTSLEEDLDLVFPEIDRDTYLESYEPKRATTVMRVISFKIYFHKSSAIVNVSQF